jgi:hypothetical protein
MIILIILMAITTLVLLVIGFTGDEQLCNKEMKGYKCKHGYYVINGKRYRECDGSPF